MKSIDQRVMQILHSRDGAVTAADVAAALGVSRCAATRSLQRIASSGMAHVRSEIVVTPTRVSEIVLHYQIRPRRTFGLPEWLDPRRLPVAVASVRRHVLSMSEAV